MGYRCNNVTKKQVTKEINRNTFTNLGIDVGTLTNAECASVIDLLLNLNENQGKSVEAILENKSMVAKAIALARSKKIEEELLASEPVKIGNAEVVIGGTFKKSDARGKETLHVFTDNLQAYNALADEGDKVGTELTINPKEGVKVNVNYTSATIRTDSNGEKNPNAYGLVVKKNAQMEDGHFTDTPEDYTKGNFQDTDKEFKIFVDVNTKIIHNIKEALLSNDSPYKRFNIVKGIALNNAGLPKRFADKLAEMLETELDLISLVLPSSKGGYGLEILEVNPKLSKKNTKSKKQAELQKELKKSLEAERPISAVDTVDTNPENRSLLSKVFPEIENRKARVDFINNRFSDSLSYWLQQAKDYYNSMSDEEMSEEDIANKGGLNYGNSAEQRIYALRHLTVEGIPLAQYIFKEIQDTMLEVISAVDNNLVEDFVENVLLNRNTQMGNDFAEEAYARGWEGTELEEKAKMRTHHLANEFKKMLNRDVFDALLREVAFDLEFNENIRLDIDGMPVLTKQDIDDVELEEGKEDANKEGYMIKYKLIDPATTLSVRMKTLLAGMYKIKYSDNGNTYAFDDLGQRIRMNPSAVYYILLDEFSKMNKPEDMDIIIDIVKEKYPWMYAIADKIQPNSSAYDPDLRREFYTAFHKSLLHAAKIDKNGKIVRLNRDAKSETFLAEVLKAYEGHQVLGNNSIYTDTGECDEYNVANLRKLVEAGTSFKDNYYNHPLYWAKQILQTVNSTAYTIENLLKVLLLLRGKDTTHPNISLTALLNNLGVDTSNMNMEALLPDLDDITEEDINREALEEDMSALDYFEQNYFTRALMIKISNIIQAAMNITRKAKGNEGGYLTGDHLINKFQSTYLMIGSALTLASDGYTQTSFRNGSDKVTRLSYVAPDKIAEMTGIISNIDDIQGGTEYIEQNFGRFPWFRKDDVWNNTLLELLYEPGENGDYIVRQNFEYLNVLDFDDGKGIKSFGLLDNKQLMKSMAYAFYAANDDARGNKYGYYRSPLFSDTEACVLLKLPRLSHDRIIEGLVKVMNQEFDRILAIKNKKSTDLKIDFFDKNGQKFQFFPELNTDEVLAKVKKLELENNAIEYVRKRQEYFLELATSILDKYTLKFLQSFSESEKIEMYNNIISSTKDKENTTVDLDEKPSEKASQEKLAEADRLLTEFYQNDFFMQSQIIQLYGTDIAYYKNFRDFIKRNKLVYACGERIYARDEDGNPLKEKCLYLEDLNMVSNTWSSIKDLLNSAADKKIITQMEADILKGAVNSFKKINATDGLSFRTMKSFRKIFKAMGGKWTESMEAAYKRITEEHIIKPEDFRALWHPIKPFMFSYEAKTINGRLEKIPVQHKNSEYLLSAMYSMLNTALNDSPELKALHKFMEDNDIDVVHFRSVVKEGGFSYIDINYNKDRFRQLSESGYVELSDGTKIKAPDFNTYMKNLEEALSNEEITQEVFNKGVNMMRFHRAETAYKELERQIASKDSEGKILKDANEKIVLNEDMVHEFPLDDYMVVQPTGDHLTDEEALFGSQLRNIIPADLPEDFSMEITVGDTTRTLNREEAVQYYNTLIVDNLLDSFQKVNKKFDNIEKLLEALLLAMKGNPKYGDDVKAALLLNESKTAFKIPFNSPNLTNKIEELILSTFKNSIQKQKIAGGNVVLVSNYGLTDKLSIKYRNNDPTQGIEYIPAYMPAFMRDMVEDYLEEVTDESGTYWTINFKELEKTNPDLLKVIGYRIPTEDKYSAMPIKIVGFMPEIAGTTIMLPSDIVNMSGTDFDIDKLFIMRKAVKRQIYKSGWKRGYLRWVENKKKQYEQNDKELGDFLNKIMNTSEEIVTEAEIADYERQHLSVEDFFKEEGYKYRLEKPIYNEIKPKIKDDSGRWLSLDEISRQASKEARNNMLIDAIWNILTSPAGSLLSMMPGEFDAIKHSSRQQRILHNKQALVKFKLKYASLIELKGIFKTLMSLDIKALDKFYEENASPESPMDIMAYARNHRNLMDGNDLIGMFAVNSSNHYKFQFLGLHLTDGNRFKINGVEITAIDPVNSPLNGVRVGRICSWFQAASPDNGKDPCLGDLGANQNTVGRIGFLARIGLDAESIGVLNTLEDKIDGQSSFLDFCKLYKDKVTTTKTLSSFNGDIDKITSLMVDYRIKGEEQFRTDLDESDVEFLGMLTQWMEHINMVSDVLKQASSVSRVDSPNGALPVSTAEAIQLRFKALDFIYTASSRSCPISGLTDIVDIDLDATEDSDVRDKILNSKIPRLQAAYTLGIKSASSLAKRYLVQMGDNSLKLANTLRNLTKNPLLSKKDIKTLKIFYAELSMYLLSKDSIFSTEEQGKTLMEKRNYYIHDFPMKFYQYLNAKDTEGRYIHQKVRNLNFIQRISNASEKGISFLNVGKVSPQSRKHYTEELESMLYMDSETAKLAMDLFMYAYYDNGLNFGHSNYGIFFTTQFLQAMPRYIKSLNYANGLFLSIPDYADDFVYQFLLNHPDLIFEVKKRKGFNYTTITDSKTGKERIKILGKTRGDVSNILAGINETDGKTFVELIRVGKKIYRLVHGETLDYTNIQYEEVEYNKMDTPYYDATVNSSNIKWEELQGRGAVGSIKEDKKTKKKTDKSKETTPDNSLVPTDDYDPIVPNDVDVDSEGIAKSADLLDAVEKQDVPDKWVNVAESAQLLENNSDLPDNVTVPKDKDIQELKNFNNGENPVCE